MDIFAHGLWSAAAARGVNLKEERRAIPVAWAAFWGVFPDLFAFTYPFIRAVVERISGVHGARPDFALASKLYHISHSLIVFSAVIGAVWLVRRRLWLPMLAWPLHVLCDIPSHTRRFFPTPFLWPLSHYEFSGISWGNPWFMLVNYTALGITYYVLWRRTKAAKAARPSAEPLLRSRGSD